MAPQSPPPPHATATHPRGYRYTWLLAMVALAIQCHVSGSSRNESAAEMYTEAKNMLINSPAGGAVIINGVAVGDLVSLHHGLSFGGGRGSS